MEKDIDENSPGEFENVKFRMIQQPRLTFFYEKLDGSVFAAEEQEAANGKYNKHFRYLGWSNGEAYNNVIRKENLKKGQVISKEKAQTMLKAAFDAELEVAKKNLTDAKEAKTRVIFPRRTEWYFDSSVPEEDRYIISKGKYGQSTRD